MLFLHRPRVSRALSAFDHASRRWAAIPLRDPHESTTQCPHSPRLADSYAVAEKILPGAGRDLLDEDDVGRLGSLEDMVENEPGACGGP